MSDSTPAATSVSETRLYTIREKLAELEQSLLNKTPNMPTLLRDIHRQLKNDPDIVTILSEDEINILVSGLKKQTGVEISTAVLKQPNKKALKSTTLDDL